jgi:hypothetical protein
LHPQAAAERLAGHRTLAQIPRTLRQAAAVADIAVQLGEALHDRYVIEHELGRGGMATVYLARDLKHERLVALKVLHPKLGAALGELYEQRGQRAEAIDAYGRFAGLWKGADPALQPAVRDVRQRMAALAGEH